MIVNRKAGIRMIALAGAALIAIAGASAPAAAQTGQREYSIQSQDLGKALREFAIESGTDVVFDPGLVRGKTSTVVSGRHSAETALRIMLRGTNLVVRRTGSGGFTVAAGNAARSSRGESTASVVEPDASEAGEIVVTAQKREERLQDVPVPVSVLRAVNLANNNQLRIQDYYTKVPGLSLALVGNGNEPVITIRGVTTGGVEPVNPTVGVVVDDVSYGASVAAPAVPDIDPSDLARVEVLRGPQGTLYGASSIGGLLKFVTVDPSTDALAGRVQVGISAVEDGDVGYVLRGAINVPLSDTLAIRASGFTSRDGGYVDNIQTGQNDINRRASDGGRVSLLWRPSSDFSVKLSALIQDSVRRGSPDVDTSLGEGLDQNLLRGTGAYGRKTQAYSATLNASLGTVDVISVTGYNIDKLSTNLDATKFFGFGDLADAFFGVSGSGIALQNEIEKFTQEVRASIPVSDQLTWLIGGFYTHEDIKRVNDAQAVDPATGNVAGLLLGSSLPIKFEEHAVFTNITYAFSDRFDIQVGGRFSKNKQRYSTVRSGALAGIFFGSDPFILPDSSSSDDALTYLVTPRFRVSPDLMLYARMASGYRPGGPNVNCGGAGIPCEFKADRTQNFELGVKGSAFDRRLTFDGSLYYIDWRDVQVELIPGALLYTDNVARAESYGAEVSFEARPAQGLSVSGWFAWNEAQLAEDFPVGTTVAGRAGDRLPYSSRFSGNLSVDQDVPLSDGVTGFLGASMSYVGDRKGKFQATAIRQTFPSYVQFDLRGGLRTGDWTVNLYVTNLTNKRGVLNGGLDAIVDPNLFAYIQPRTFGASLVKEF